MKINLDKCLIGLDGQEIKNSKMSQQVATIIGNSNKGNAIKLFDQALSLYKTGEVELDDVDYKAIYELIEHTDVFTNLCKGQVLKELISQKEKKYAKAVQN